MNIFTTELPVVEVNRVIWQLEQVRIAHLKFSYVHRYFYRLYLLYQSNMG
jgi:hypothetical protein